MLGSEILEVAIGLILVYLLLSFICSAVREGLEGWLRTRAVHLERGIRELLNDLDGDKLTQQVYGHPLVSGLFRGSYDPRKIKTKEAKNGGSAEKGLMPSRSDLPTYIPASNFAVALMDVVARGPVAPAVAAPSTDAVPLSIDSLRASVLSMENASVRRALLAAIDMAQGDLARAQANIEAWFNSCMDRVSGWYKRRTQLVLLVIALGVTITANVNTLTIAEHLYRDDASREVLVAQAGTVGRDGTLQQQQVQQLYTRLDSLNLPIGWDGVGREVRRTPPEEGSPARLWYNLWNNAFWDSFHQNPWQSPVYPLLGWLVTAFAVSLGAPFWFDLLNKVMVIRSTVKPHEKSPEEASEDRQLPRTGPPPRLGAPSPRGAHSGETSHADRPPAAGSRPMTFQPHEWAGDNPQDGVL